jgi:hypothetical protein
MSEFKFDRLMQLKRDVINTVTDVIANSNTDADLKTVRINHMADLISVCDDCETLLDVYFYIQDVKFGLKP